MNSSNHSFEPRFSTKKNIADIIYSIDPEYEKTHNKELYLIWYYGREILPGHPNFEYTRGMGQFYLISAFMKNSEFRNLYTWFPGFRDLYMSTMKMIA